MTEDLYGWGGFSSHLLLIGWLIAGFRTGRLVFSRTPYKLRRNAWSILILIILIEVFVLAKMISIALSWTAGGWLLQQKWLLELVLLAAPSAVVLFLTVPRLLRVARMTPAEPELFCNAELRLAAAAPGIVAAVQSASVGAAGAFYLTWFATNSLSLQERIIPLGIWAIAAGLLWVRQRRRCLAVGQTDWKLPPPAAQFIQAAAVLLAIAALAFVSVVAASHASRLPDRLSMLALQWTVA